jgi:polar amino acid transport system substrate-binding protein
MGDEERDEDLRRLLEGVEGDSPDPEFVDALRARFRAEAEARHGSGAATGDRGGDPPVFALPQESDAGGAHRRWWRGAAAVAAAAAILVGLIAVGTLGDDTSRVQTTGGPDDSTQATGPTTPSSALDPAACVTEVEQQEAGALTVAALQGQFALPDQRDQVAARFAYESALLYAVADRLGFAEEDVVVDFRSRPEGGTDVAFAGTGAKDFDLAISEISATEERDERVDFVAYYDEEQVLLAPEDSVVAGAESLADLRGATFGTIRKTASLDGSAGTVYVEEVIAPSTEVVEFLDFDPEGSGPAVQAALDNGTIDALVIDRYTADFALTSPEGEAGFTDVSILGVLPRPAEPSGQLGMLLEQGSALVPCVEAAVAELRADGTLDRLETEYLDDGGSIPTLTR